MRVTCETWLLRQRPCSLTFSTEEVLEMLFSKGENHLGMSSDEESEIDRDESGVSR